MMLTSMIAALNLQVEHLARKNTCYDDHEVFDEMSVNKLLKKECTWSSITMCSILRLAIKV